MEGDVGAAAETGGGRVIINIMKMMLIMKRTNRLFSEDADVALTCNLQLANHSADSTSNHTSNNYILSEINVGSTHR